MCSAIRTGILFVTRHDKKNNTWFAKISRNGRKRLSTHQDYRINRSSRHARRFTYGNHADTLVGNLYRQRNDGSRTTHSKDHRDIYIMEKQGL
jgi:hypothetical protein